MAKHTRSLASKMGPARSHWSGGQFRDAAKAVARAADWKSVLKAYALAEQLKSTLYVASVDYHEKVGTLAADATTRALRLDTAREQYVDQLLGDLTRHVFHRLQLEDPEAFRRLRSYT